MAARISILSTMAVILMMALTHPVTAGMSKTIFKLSSPAFENGQAIPKRYTGEGSDVSPSLRWSDVPMGAKALALLCEDPDAPQPQPWVHWLIYDLEPSVKGLPEAFPKREQVHVPIRARQGRNSFGSIGYNGPLPPRHGGVHHYHFMLYALSENVELPAGLSKAAFLKKIKGHILGETELIGTYIRE